MRSILENVVSEFLLAINAMENLEGKDASEDIIHTFVTQLVDSLVSKSLNDKHPKKGASNEEMCTFTEANFRGMKQTLQMAMADGFSKAIYRFSGTPLNYVCEVAPTRDPSNKLPN